MVYPITDPLRRAPPRRGRRLRRRGGDDAGPDRLRDDARGRGRAAVGPAAGRGAARVPPLDRPARDGRTTTTTAPSSRRARRARRTTATSTPPSTRASTARSTSAAACSRRPGATEVLWTGLVTTHIQGSCRMGSDPGALGRRRPRRVHGRQAALRRRRLGHPADALRQPVADDHGARRPPRRPPARRPARLPRVTRTRSRPRAPLARRAADAEAGREPPLLPRDPRHGGRRRERRLGLPALLRRLRARVAEAHAAAQPGVGHIAYRTHSPEALERRVAALEAAGARAHGSTATSVTAAPTASSTPTATASSCSTSPSATRRRRSFGPR